MPRMVKAADGKMHNNELIQHQSRNLSFFDGILIKVAPVVGIESWCVDYVCPVLVKITTMPQQSLTARCFWRGAEADQKHF